MIEEMLYERLEDLPHQIWPEEIKVNIIFKDIELGETKSESLMFCEALY